MAPEHLSTGELVAAQYDIGQVRRCERYPQGFVNTTFRIEAERGSFALTAFRQKALREVEARAEVLMRLRSVPIARPLLSKNGRRVIDLNGRPAWLTPWIEGKSFVGQQHDQKVPMSQRQHQEVIHAFDNLHRELLHISAENIDLLPFRAGNAGEELRISPERNVQSLIAQCRECYQEVVAQTAPQPSLVHHDFERQNLLFRGDTLAAILDFDALGIGDVQQEWAHTTFNHACCDPQQSAEHLKMYVEHSVLGNEQRMSRKQLLAAMARFCEEDIHGFLWIARRKPIDLDALVAHYSKALTFAIQHLS